MILIILSKIIYNINLINVVKIPLITYFIIQINRWSKIIETLIRHFIYLYVKLFRYNSFFITSLKKYSTGISVIHKSIELITRCFSFAFLYLN